MGWLEWGIDPRSAGDSCSLASQGLQAVLDMAFSTHRIRSAERQNPRLDYLWTHGGFSGGKSFALLHLERVLRGDVTGEAEAPSQEEEHAG